MLAQSQALPYAAALAHVAADHEPQPSRAESLRDLAGRMQHHHQEILALLRPPK